MAQVNDVAQKIYDDLGWIGAMRQQKLAYFIQAWALAWTGRPLFHERVEAWPNGPVVAPLWRDNRYYREGRRILAADTSRLTADEIKIVDAVLAYYNRLSTDALRDLSHDEPWLQARDGLAPDAASNREVPMVSVARHYTRLAILSPDVPVKPALDPPVEAPARLVEAESTRQMGEWAETLARLAAV